MHIPFEIDGIDLVLGAILLGLLLSLRHRVKQRRDAAIRDQAAETRPVGDALDDGFYCIMLKDGTCRSGFMEGDKE